MLKYTDHILLVGEGAKRFALSYGFKEEDLLTPESRQLWLTWRANRDQDDDWLNVPENEPLVARPTGTINLNVVNAKGERLLHDDDQRPGLEDSRAGRVIRRSSARGSTPTTMWARRLHRTGRGEHHGLRRISHGRSTCAEG